MTWKIQILVQLVFLCVDIEKNLIYLFCQIDSQYPNRNKKDRWLSKLSKLTFFQISKWSFTIKLVFCLNHFVFAVKLDAHFIHRALNNYGFWKKFRKKIYKLKKHRWNAKILKSGFCSKFLPELKYFDIIGNTSTSMTSV